MSKHVAYPWRNNPEAMASRVKELSEEGHGVNSGAMQKQGGEHTALINHATKTLKLSWDDVLEKAGLSEVKKREKVTYPWRNDVAAMAKRVRELHEKRLPVNSDAMTKRGGEHLALVAHATQTLKLHWDDILAKAGLSGQKKQERVAYLWRNNVDAMVARVKELHEEGHRINFQAMRRHGGEHRSLVAHTNRLDISWGFILEKAGLSGAKMREHAAYPWRDNPDAMAARVRELHDGGLAVNSFAMQNRGGEDRALVQHSSQLQLPWSDVLMRAGLDPKEIRKDSQRPPSKVQLGEELRRVLEED